VLGITALFLCWVPIVNNFAAILAVVGLALGVPALISARRGKRTGSGLAVASVILSVLAIVGVLATQAFYSSVIDDVTNDLNSSEADASASEAAVLPSASPRS
jgi:thiol:disulfide interchange protein